MPPRRASNALSPDQAKTSKRFKAWSISRYLDHSGPDGCPRRARLRHLDKVDAGPVSDAMRRGRAVHDAGEKWLNKKLHRMPIEYSMFRDEMRAARMHLLSHEACWAVDSKWAISDWFAADAWCRIKVDLVVGRKEKNRALMVDFKTGQMRTHRIEEYRMQLELYAIGAFICLDDLEYVECELWYLDQGIIYGGEQDGYVYTAQQANELRKVWASRVQPMLRDKSFKPRPGNYCMYCPYSSNRGGQCKY